MRAVSQMSIPAPLLVQSGIHATVATGTARAASDSASARGGTRGGPAVLATRATNLRLDDPPGERWFAPPARDELSGAGFTHRVTAGGTYRQMVIKHQGAHGILRRECNWISAAVRHLGLDQT